MPTRQELAESAWDVGLRVEGVRGSQAVTMVRKVPKVLSVRCRACLATWEAKVGRDGKCARGWRRCPQGCNAKKLSKHPPKGGAA